MMTALFDIALLTISGCSALYCWSLSRRLRSLQNLKKGLGQSVVTLTKSVTAVEANAEKLNREARAAVDDLRQTLGKVDGAQERVDILLETMDRQARETWKDHRKKAQEVKTELGDAVGGVTSLMKDAKAMSGMMNDQLIAWSEREDKAFSSFAKKREALEAFLDAQHKDAAKAFSARKASLGRDLEALVRAQADAHAKSLDAAKQEVASAARDTVETAANKQLAAIKQETARLAALRGEIGQDLAAAKRLLAAMRDVAGASARPAAPARAPATAAAPGVPANGTAASRPASPTVVPLRPAAPAATGGERAAPVPNPVRAAANAAPKPAADASKKGPAVPAAAAPGKGTPAKNEPRLSERDAEIAQSLARRLANVRRQTAAQAAAAKVASS